MTKEGEKEDMSLSREIEEYLEGISIKQLKSYQNQNKIRSYRISFALSEHERKKMLTDQRRKGFENLSEYIRDTLIYNQRGSNERLASEFILKLSQLGEKVTKYQEHDIIKLKKMIIEEIIKIIRELE